MRQVLHRLESPPARTANPNPTAMGSTLLFEHMAEQEALPVGVGVGAELQSLLEMGNNDSNNAVYRLRGFYVAMMRLRSECMYNLTAGCSSGSAASDIVLIDVCSRALVVMGYIYDTLI